MTSLLTTPQVAALLDVSERTVREWSSPRTPFKDRLRPIRIGDFNIKWHGRANNVIVLGH